MVGAGQQLGRLHRGVELVLVGLIFHSPRRPPTAPAPSVHQHRAGGRRVRVSLRRAAGVRLVDGDREASPRCSLPILSRMNVNFCTVEMMIFLPLSMNRRRSAERSALPYRRAHGGILPDHVVDLPVQDAAVSDHDDRVEHRGVVCGTAQFLRP